MSIHSTEGDAAAAGAREGGLQEVSIVGARVSMATMTPSIKGSSVTLAARPAVTGRPRNDQATHTRAQQWTASFHSTDVKTFCYVVIILVTFLRF